MDEVKPEPIHQGFAERGAGGAHRLDDLLDLADENANAWQLTSMGEPLRNTPSGWMES